MAEFENIDPKNGSLTSPMNTETREFQEFQLFISKKAKELSKKQKLQIDFFAIQIKKGLRFRK